MSRNIADRCRYIDISSMNENTSVVAKALATNLVIAAAKATAGVFAGSSSLLSEAAHSFVDSSTEAILLVGTWHGRKWDNARYFWGLFASINIFAIGGVYACWEGYKAIAEPEAGGTAVWIGLLVLGISAAIEATSWMRAVRSLAAEKGDQSWYRLLRTTRSTDIKAIVVEDSADISGCLLAVVGIVLKAVTGSPVWDGLASMAIGLMLIATAYELGAQNFKLLVMKEVVV